MGPGLLKPLSPGCFLLGNRKLFLSVDYLNFSIIKVGPVLWHLKSYTIICTLSVFSSHISASITHYRFIIKTLPAQVCGETVPFQKHLLFKLLQMVKH